MKIILTLLLFLPGFIFSQKLVKNAHNYEAKIEYSVTSKSVDFIYDNAGLWIESEFPKRDMYMSIFYPKSKKISGIVYYKKYRFLLEINCYNGYFITKFNDFFFKDKKLSENRVDEVNQYLFLLAGRMQKFIRYNE